MPMIDIYAKNGTFADPHGLAREAAATLMSAEKVPDIAMFRKNTAAFIHELPETSISNVDGERAYVRVQVITNHGALDRDKQIAVVSQLTDVVAKYARDADLRERTWVVLTEATEGGWGLWGHAHTNADIVATARAELAKQRSCPREQRSPISPALSRFVKGCSGAKSTLHCGAEKGACLAPNNAVALSDSPCSCVLDSNPFGSLQNRKFHSTRMVRAS